MTLGVCITGYWSCDTRFGPFGMLTEFYVSFIHSSVG